MAVATVAATPAMEAANTWKTAWIFVVSSGWLVDVIMVEMQDGNLCARQKRRSYYIRAIAMGGCSEASRACSIS